MSRRAHRRHAVASVALHDACASVAFPAALPATDHEARPVDQAAPPAASGIVWRDEPRAATIVLPPPGACAATVPAALGAVLILCAGLVAGLAPAAPAWAGGLVLGAAGAASLAVALCACHAREQLQEIRDGLHLCRLLGGRAFGHRFVCKRFVEGVALQRTVRLAGVTTTESVVLHTDTETWHVGARLSPEGRAWLHRTLRQLACR